MAIIPTGRFFAAIKQMANGENRMATQQSRAGITHHLPNPVAHIGFVAMNKALGTGRLGCTERTLTKPQQRIIQ